MSDSKTNRSRKASERTQYEAKAKQPKRKEAVKAARVGEPDLSRKELPTQEVAAKTGQVSDPEPAVHAKLPNEEGIIPADSSIPYRYDGPPIPSAEVPSPAGFIPFQPPPEIAEEFDDSRDDPLNPKGALSPQWPQQATPLTSLQGVEPMEVALDHRGEHERAQAGEVDPDNPLNPKGTPDILVAEDPPTEIRALKVDGQPKSSSSEPLKAPTAYTDNPLNPRGVPDYLADGSPDSTASDAQKIQDPYPRREGRLPTDLSVSERVSAGQNRQPPLERIP